MKVTSLMLRKIRSSQPSTTASEAYAEMERARVASLNASMPREVTCLRAFTA